MRNHLEKVLWSDGFYIESHEGNESQEGSMNTDIDGLVYFIRIIFRSITSPCYEKNMSVWMKNMKKSLEFSQKQTTFAPTFWIKNGRLAQLV